MLWHRSKVSTREWNFYWIFLLFDFTGGIFISLNRTREAVWILLYFAADIDSLAMEWDIY